MKTAVKILTALAAVAGAVFVVATYGEQIVAWAKKIMEMLPKCPSCQEAGETAEVVEEPAAEEVAAEEAPAEEPAAEEAAEEPAPEVVVAENEPVAEDHDFAE